MRRQFFWFLLIGLLITPLISLAAELRPDMVVVPFAQTLTLAKNSSTNVLVVVQNNTGVNLTITNLVPHIPSRSLVKVKILETNCGFLAPLDSCGVIAQIQTLNKLGRGKLNLFACAFNGTLCSRITQDISLISAPLVEIQVFPTNPIIANGTTQQFSAFALLAGQIIQDITTSVTWRSSDVSKATISNASGTQGLATGISVGTSIISATLNGVSGSSTLSIKPATLTSITIIPVTKIIAKGTTAQFFAVGIFSDNTSQNITSLVTWNSSNQAVATISNTIGSKGLASGKSVGISTITASAASVTGTASLNVTIATLTSISVTPTNPTLVQGGNQQFTATGIYSDNTTKDLTKDATWNTGSAQIAIVSDNSGTKGLALGVNVGITSVTAKFGQVTGSTNITVKPATLVSIDVSPKNDNLIAGQTLQYKATGIFSDRHTQDITNTVTWISSNKAIATITSQGLATGISVGGVTISATQQGITGNTLLTVKPVTLLSIAVTPTNPTIANGTQQQFKAIGTYSDASTKDITTQVTWISSAPAVAVISNVAGSSGLATGVSVGASIISASLAGVTGNTSLQVSAASLVSIAITPTNASIPVNTTVQYTATGTFSDASTKDITNEVTWESTDTSKATISNANGTKGLATGVNNGTTTINAFFGAVMGTTTLTVVTVSIGDSLQGGVVACLDGGLNNLIVANINNSLAITWGGSGTVTNAQSDVDGSTNTTTIVSVLGAATTYAAGLCDAYEIDSAGNSPCVVGNTCYNDWFLAAINQNACMQDNRNQIGGFEKQNYWTSTENSVTPGISAWFQTFANSGKPPATEDKTSTFVVRCVRLMNG